jgi:hypothetical protein
MYFFFLSYSTSHTPNKGLGLEDGSDDCEPLAAHIMDVTLSLSSISMVGS